jgi:hypothetical protein
MKTTMKITMPESWADISLSKYLALQYDLEAYKDDREAQMNFMISHLCGIDSKDILGLTQQSYAGLQKDLFNFINDNKAELQRFITIDGVEYGFEPNLSKMTYGAYADITRYETISVDTNWKNIMNILYRPVVAKSKGGTYEIQSYEGNTNPDKWLKVSMDKHFGCMFFFVNLSMDLLNSTLNSTIQTMEVPQSYKQILERSGKIIQQSLNLQAGIFNK